MMIKSDIWIEKMACRYAMIDPFESSQIRDGVISYGLSSYGYDIRVADEFKIFTNVNNTVVDPKNFDANSFVEYQGEICTIPPNSFALARSVEYMRMPRNVTGIVLGKSTYARCGVVTNFTPLEACYSPDTEVLTQQGWRLIGDVVVGNRVLSLNPETQMAEWQIVEQTHEHYNTKPMINFNGRHIDLLVTQNHKVYVDKRKGQKKWDGWKLRDACEIYGKYNHSMSRMVNWTGEKPDILHLAGRKFNSEKFAYFLGVYLGDGWTTINTGKGNYVIRLGAKKKRKINSHSQAIEGIGFVPYINKNHSVQFQNKELALMLQRLGKAKDKYIPEYFKNLHPSLLDFVIRGMIDSDGNKETDTFYTSSKRLADDFQEIVFKSGKSAIIREIESVPTKLIPGDHGTRYVVRITVNRIHEMSPSTHRLVDYKGFVYCIGVPNHIIFVRRNGKPVWSGNSWEGHITIEISNTTPLPARIYANEGIAQILFFASDDICRVSYNERVGGGKYQGQVGITLPKI